VVQLPKNAQIFRIHKLDVQFLPWHEFQPIDWLKFMPLQFEEIFFFKYVFKEFPKVEFLDDNQPSLITVRS
jgi:hypothetical protein